VPIIFETFDSSTATSAEVTLSQSLQTVLTNFAKNPNSSPAPHWHPYEPEDSENAHAHTLAKITYQGNVDFGKFVEPVQPDSTVSTRNDDAKFSSFIYEFLVHKQDEPCNIAYSRTIAKIAYEGNVDWRNFVQPVKPDSIVSTRSDDAKFSLFIYEFLVHKQDEPCKVWDHFLDYRP
jgi:cytochrome c1